MTAAPSTTAPRLLLILSAFALATSADPHSNEIRLSRARQPHQQHHRHGSRGEDRERAGKGLILRLKGGAGGMPMPGGMPMGGMPGMQGAPPPSLSQLISELHPVYLSLLVTMSWNSLGFLLTTLTKSFYLTDAMGTSAFILSALATTNSALNTQWNKHRRNWAPPSRPLILSWAVGLWAARLGGYLTTRMASIKQDKRISKHFRKPGEIWLCGDSCYPFNLMAYWFRQAMWSWICLLPVSWAADLKKYRGLNAKGFVKDIAPVTMLLGGVGYAMGMAVECIADAQKYNFKTDKSNSKRWRWCDKGLWAFSRHPNYFGEMLIWAGIFLMALPIAPLWTIISPVFVWWLLRHKTGVPLLEEDMKRKYWSHPDFDNYMKSTRLLVPWPGKVPEETPSPFGISGDTV
mmetsp:Transcript_26483/g.63942  ORF Transcript_26483/g.63942 Transcript_26483/m.63942 type:complete len:404 (-) Transcript_26483:358-1569(-)|eukprot:CAMPEP_0114513248 /NCGR_PEP_ID=MMETSP0109-20121206/15452_1 /TAXON_ID=29199 /ORGANISM="Chlorarachnion reptans, Strain CCCM449" /LENGTH=403 /DNA_ID=CAMNT_0001693075 /DNA_START=122 /DNA_END=1333 /DNA_ORIENTATION=+